MPRVPAPRSPRPALRLVAAGMAVPAWLPAAAHEGHGLPGHAHWHATDVPGFVALGVAVAALVWWRGRR